MTIESTRVEAAVVDAAAFDSATSGNPRTKRGKLLQTLLGDSVHVHVCDVLVDVFRVLKPGGHVLVSAAPEEADLIGLGLRAAGFEVRDVLGVFSAMGRVDWFLGRRPLEGTVAGNVLGYGTGALNIDGTRIVTHESTERPQGRDIRGGRLVGSENKSNLITGGGCKGRFPTHTVLTHHPSCEPCGVKKVQAAGWTDSDVPTKERNSVYGRRIMDVKTSPHYADKDGTETVPSFNCAAYCQTCNMGFLHESGASAVDLPCGEVR